MASWFETRGVAALLTMRVSDLILRSGLQAASPRMKPRRLLHPLDQLHGARRRTHLALVDDIGEHVAWRFCGLGLVDARQVVRLAAAGPGLKTPGPGIELLGRVAGLQLVIALLQ